MDKIKKILVLMSGGVDSSTAAALLCKQGYDVSGVYLKFYAGGDSCWSREMQDAARAAAKLKIPFQVWDVTKDYQKQVLKDFYKEYASGKTPNPDVLCNSEIKFGIGLKRALKLGYDFVASGHYARVRKPSQPPSPVLRPPSPLGRGEGEGQRGGKGELWQLCTGKDKNKDQSYFLWKLTQKQLAHIIFPIGNYTKPQVRELAKEFVLHNASKKDSQGVCFLGKIDLKDFLSQRVKMRPGKIVNTFGKLLGQHTGLAQFTIGQRHGGNISDGQGPYYVVGKDFKKNTLIVANAKQELKYRAIGCKIKKVNWIGVKPAQLSVKARIRYRGELFKVLVKGDNVKFQTPTRAMAQGQSIVFYNRDKIIGGGIIDRITLLNNL